MKSMYFFILCCLMTVTVVGNASERCNSTTATVGSTPMNFSVVRNNIYRVSIESINPLDGRLSLKLAVHDWRNVEHPTINI